jgi:hypothetical protein
MPNAHIFGQMLPTYGCTTADASAIVAAAAAATAGCNNPTDAQVEAYLIAAAADGPMKIPTALGLELAKNDPVSWQLLRDKFITIHKMARVMASIAIAYRYNHTEQVALLQDDPSFQQSSIAFQHLTMAELRDMQRQNTDDQNN